MKNIIICVLLIVLSSCTNPTSEKTQEGAYVPTQTSTPLINEQLPNLIVDPDFKNFFITHLPFPEYEISDEDYKKHNDIMDYLYEFPNKSEKELYKELSKVYGESAEDLEFFMVSKMQVASDRDLGKTKNYVIQQNDLSEVLSDMIFVLIVANSNDDTIKSACTPSITGRRVVADCDLVFKDQRHNLLIKFEFSDDFQSATIFQIKFNGTNIDF